MDTMELIEKQQRAHNAMREIHERAVKEDRSLTAEEEAAWNKAEAECNRLTDEIQRQRKLESNFEQAGYGNKQVILKPELEPFDSRADSHSEEVRAFFDRMFGSREDRALMKDKDSAGGYSVLPQDLHNDIIRKKDDEVFVRAYATKYTVRADSKGIPILQNNPVVSWGGEITNVEWDSTMTFEKSQLFPHRLTGAIKISKDLLKLSVVDMRNFIVGRLAYSIAIEEEEQFLVGTGVSKPLGLFTVSDVGVDSSRNVSAGNTSSAVTGDGLINCLYGLRSTYLRGRCRWIFHRSVLMGIKKLKNGSGDYFFQIDAAGVPRILGVEVVQSEYAPNAMTSGSRVGLVGDLSYYAIAEYDASDVLIDPYSDGGSNQTRIILTQHVDGAPTLAEPFSVVTLA